MAVFDQPYLRDGIALQLMKNGIISGYQPPKIAAPGDPLAGGATIAQPTVGMPGGPTGGWGPKPGYTPPEGLKAPGTTPTPGGMIDQPTIGMAPGTATKAADFQQPAPAPQWGGGDYWGNLDSMSQMQFPGSGTGGG